MNSAILTAPIKTGLRLSCASNGSSTRQVTNGRFSVRIARTAEDFEAALRLRYEVFNLELGEGLTSAFRTGRECDEFDADSEHLIIVDQLQRRVIGTLRLRTYEIAKTTEGFYSSQQFDLSALPPKVLANAIEVGRVCIAKTHRNIEAQMLLLKGLGLSLLRKDKRYLFGSLSLSTRDPMQAGRIFEQLTSEGHLHPEFRLVPRPGSKCLWYKVPDGSRVDVAVSSWIRRCLQFGAKLCGPPASNRQFRTIDLPFVLDGKQLDEISGPVSL
jgi:putative hemolysin